jgi:penicillin amidase
VELARLKILLEDGPDALRDLDPAYATEGYAIHTAASRAEPAVDAVARDLDRFTRFAGAHGGSNAWALAGSRTASGRALLANDPHLEPVLPAHWYLAHLTTPGWSVAGAALVGTPGFGAGHNGFAAWGVTAGLADTVDLFLEEVTPDGRAVRRGEGFEPCRRRSEVIEVRGRSTVIEEVLETPRGPIIGPALIDTPYNIALRALWLDPRPARGFLRAHTANTFEALRGEFQKWALFSQNLLYADVEGHIAWQLVGAVPRRRAGHGTMPQTGADPDHGWLDGDVPIEEMPFCTDPPEGFLVTANEDPALVAPSAPQRTPFLGVDWMDPYRGQRIREALAGERGWDLGSTMRLQLDELVLPWRQLRDVFLAARPRSDAGREALARLRTWDGIASRQSQAATLFQLLLAEMWQRVVMARAPKSKQWALGRGFTRLLGLTTFSGGRPSRIIRHLREQPLGWFARPWPDEIGDALDCVVLSLGERFGADPARWSWGEVRPLTFEHPLSVVKPLAPLLSRGPFAWGGDGNTVSQAGTTPLNPLAGPTVVASLRFCAEAGDWDNARFVLPGGQSGDPFSVHYDDMLPLWLRGDGIRIAWSSAAVAAAAVHVLELKPLA